MSEKDGKRKGPYGKPAPARGTGGERRPFGKPAAGDKPRYGKPASGGDKPRYGRPAPEGERRYGKPAPAGDKPRYGKPAPDGERRYGKPAPAGDKPRYGKPAPDGERRYGKPAPSGDKPRYGKPAPDGERRYGKPAPAGDKPRYGKPAPDGERRYGKPAPAGDKPRFGRPAPTGDRPRFARPAPDGERRSFGGPAPGRHPGPGRPDRAPMESDARKAALTILNRVLLESGYASLSLDEHFRTARLTPLDKRLCTRMVYLTLENLNMLDHALSGFLEDTERLEPRVRNLLRLSAAQILLLDRVPDSAAVNEAVKLTRQMDLEELTGLVNGVLRNLIRQKDDLQWPTKEDGTRYYHIMHSQPEWLVEQVMSDYGEEEGGRILSYVNEEHFITVRPNMTRITPEQFEDLLKQKPWQHTPGVVPGAWRLQGAEDIANDLDWIDGKFTIQGEGSMVAAEAVQPRLGSQVLDCCAAPGGKSAYLAEKMQGTGRVQAWDVHPHRVDLIQALAERLRLYNIRPAMRDALVERQQLESTMDAVIIDAPCTGTGVMQDKPDLKVRLAQEDLTALVDTQRRLLEVCSRYVRSGGTLVYATCSLLKDENERQVAAFLEKHPEFQMDALPDTIPEQLRAHEGPLGLQLLPHRDGVEGFYVARMRRV